MSTPLKELKEKAVAEITNKMVNNMTMSEVTEVVISYSEQTARKIVKELDRERLEHIAIGRVSIDKEVKRKPIKKHSGWNGEKSKKQKAEPEDGEKSKKQKAEPEDGEKSKKQKAEPEKKPEESWLNLFQKEKKQHPGWNKKDEGLLSKIKKFLKFK
jgi:hypothetical protein